VITSPALEVAAPMPPMPVMPAMVMPVAPDPVPESVVEPAQPKLIAQPPVAPVPVSPVEVEKPKLEPLRVADLPPEIPKPAAKALPSQPAPAPPKPERSGLMTVLLVLLFLLIAVGVAVYLVIQQLSKDPEVLRFPSPVGPSPISEENRKRGLFMMTYDPQPQFEMKKFFRPLASLEVQYGVDEADLLLSTLGGKETPATVSTQ
jgi:hypothetical protein